jgi:hypothetical protein
MDVLADLAPVAEGYASLPIAEAFDWTHIGQQLGAGEWYLVVFRSIRWADADDERLTAYDERAHLEAAGSPGFVHYFKGPLDRDGSCLSFCLWQSRADARAASAMPLHVEAVSILNEMYESYNLELLRVSGSGDGRLDFRPYDAAPAKAGHPGSAPAIRPAFAS